MKVKIFYNSASEAVVYTCKYIDITVRDGFTLVGLHGVDIGDGLGAIYPNDIILKTGESVEIEQ